MERIEDMNAELCLDGNAAAGLLQEIFAEEMTASPAQCAHCGKVGMLGGMRAYTQAPGLVLRCSYCGNIVLRVAITPQAVYLDARGAKYIRLDRSP